MQVHGHSHHVQTSGDGGQGPEPAERLSYCPRLGGLEGSAGAPAVCPSLTTFHISKCVSRTKKVGSGPTSYLCGADREEEHLEARVDASALSQRPFSPHPPPLSAPIVPNNPQVSEHIPHSTH